ncbi:MAG TPA: hypothetical protein ENN87_17110 [Phycisphaerales bacterium]|nr:hypothetical protein [Phycisphaerales bacterium]
MLSTHRAFLLSGAVLIWLVSYLSIAAAAPYVGAPFSMAVFAPVAIGLNNFGLSLPVAVMLGTALVPVAFLLWSGSLWRGEAAIPRRSSNLAIVIFALSVLWLMWVGQGGVQVQGLFHVIMVQGYNVFIASLLLLLYRINRAGPGLRTSLAYHWLLFAWVGWCAFPWLGPV